MIENCCPNCHSEECPHCHHICVFEADATGHKSCPVCRKSKDS